MIACRFLIVAAALFVPSCAGQKLKPDFTYTLHAFSQHRGGYTPQSPDRPLYPLILASDSSLVELIPDSKERWALKRVSGWDTRAPLEDTLWIETGFREREDVRLDGELWVNPLATYAIARIDATGGNPLRTNTHLVVVIDLRTFRSVLRVQPTNDLVTGYLEFSPTGTLLATKHTEDETAPFNTEFGALALPSLEPLAQCQYREYFDQTAKRVDKDADNRCADVLKAANRPSVMNSGKRGNASDALARTLNPDPQCGLADVSEDQRYALFDCSTSEWTIWDTLRTTSRGVKVFDIHDRTLVFNRTLPHSPDIALGFGRSQGRNWLLILREAVKLEVYKLP